jgi:hypothetical protein
VAEGDSGVRQLTAAELEAGLDEIRRSPKEDGRLELIVTRQRTGERTVLDEGRLDPAEGLVGDSWKERTHPRTGAPPSIDTQLNLMNSRSVALVAQDRARWPLAGDQLYVDLDLSYENLPPGAQLAIGEAVIEVTAEPHTGCGKFVHRFGVDAMKFVNSAVGRNLNLRGINARVVSAGRIRVGDTVRKCRMQIADRSLISQC